jgi:hypothetical protein
VIVVEGLDVCIAEDAIIDGVERREGARWKVARKKTEDPSDGGCEVGIQCRVLSGHLEVPWDELGEMMAEDLYQDDGDKRG